MNTLYQRGDVLLCKPERTRHTLTKGLHYLVDSHPKTSKESYHLVELSSMGTPGTPTFPFQWGFKMPSEVVEDLKNYERVSHIDLADREVIVGKTLLEDIPELRDFYNKPEDFQESEE